MAEKCAICGATFNTKAELAAHNAQAHPMGGKPRWPPEVNRARYIRAGAFGGLFGGVALALVMMAAGQALLGNGIAVVCSMGVAIIGLQATSTPTTILGLVIHFAAATIIGIVLAVVTLVLRSQFMGRLAITNAKNGALIGLAGGFLVWLVFGLPLMTYVLAPAMVQVMGMMMPGSMMMAEEEAKTALASPGFIGAWLVGHLLFGLVWGGTIGYAAARRGATARVASIGSGASR